ncbi:MAG: pilus motility taxis protein HmpF [Synechocystis sp.]
MLYLAEAKKQTKNFLGGYKTELKLLACQHSDQTWSALPSEEAFQTEDMGEAKDGTLWILNLSNNRSLQGAPEVAAPELVRQLQKLSRLSEKLKDQQSEIERWRESLTFQFQELNKREMDIEAKESDIEERESILSQVEQQKYEVDQAWQRLEQEREQLSHLQQQFGVLLENSPENNEVLQGLLQRLGAYPDAIPSLVEVIAEARKTSAQQQATFNQHWLVVTEAQQNLAKRQEAIAQKEELLMLHRQDLDNIYSELSKAKVHLSLEQQGISHRQQQLAQLNAEISAAEALQTNLYRLATGAMTVDKEDKIDLQHLEQLPLGELEAIVKELQADMQKLARFVNDQEEELTLQCEAVDELQTKLSEADEYSRLTLEEELNEEQERKRMLDETLIGQRRNLKERQEILLQHLKILRRRQGVIEIDDSIPNIDLDPVIQQLEVRKHKLQQERNHLEQDVQNTRQGLQQIEVMIQQLDQQHQVKRDSFKKEEEALQSLRQDIITLDLKSHLLKSMLQPLQDQLDLIKPRLEEIQALLFGD